MKPLCILLLIPTAMLLTASFFVMFANEKVGGKGLKTFGKVVAAILIFVAVIIFSKGVYVMVSGDCHAMKMICGMQKGMMHQGMMKGGQMGGKDGKCCSMSDTGSKCGSIIKPEGQPLQ